MHEATAWTAMKLSKPSAFNEVEVHHHLLGCFTVFLNAPQAPLSTTIIVLRPFEVFKVTKIVYGLLSNSLPALNINVYRMKKKIINFDGEVTVDWGNDVL